MCRFQSLYDAFFASGCILPSSQTGAHHFPLSAAAVAHLRQGRSLFAQLAARCEGYCYADYARQDFVVYGSAADLEQSAAVVAELLAPFATVRERVELPDASRVSYLVGEGGAAARALSRKTHCRCAFSKVGEAPGVVLEGCRADVEAAKAVIATRLAQYEKENATMSLPELALPILLNNRGQQVQQVQRSTHTHITIDKSHLQCAIRGKEEGVAAAQAALQAILAGITSLSLPLSPYVRGAFFGPRGQHLEELRRRHHVSVKCGEDTVCLEGLREGVAAAEAEVRAWLAKHAVRVVEGEKEAVGREVIGNHGARVRELERSHRVRVLQEDLGDTTRVVLIGPQDAVDALTASLGTSLQQYADTHFTLRLTPEHFAHAPQLARAAVEQLRARHPQCSLAVVPSLGQLRCEGDAQHLPALRSELQALQEALEDQALWSCEVAPAAAGLVIGKGGETIKALEARHHVSLRLLREEGRLQVWGSRADFEAVEAEVRARVEAGETVSEAVRATPAQLACLLKDRCRCLQEIQTASHALVRLPPRDGGDVMLTGTRASVKCAKPLLLDALRGVYTYRYAYPAPAVKALLALPTFHLERVALATQCKLLGEADGGLSIRGKGEALHRAHATVFEGLLQAAPRQFARVPLDPGTLHYLTSREGEKEKEVKGEKVKVVWELAERAVYVWGEEKEVTAARERVEKEVARLASENRVVPLEAELMESLLKDRRAKLREVSEASGARVVVLPRRDGVFVHGAAADVTQAAEALEEMARAHQERNAQLAVSPRVLAEFEKEYGAMIPQWESRYDGEVRVDKGAASICIRGRTKEGTNDLKFILESMLEEVELKLEVNAMNLTESESEKGDTEEGEDHKSEIASLLGLGSLV